MKTKLRLCKKSKLLYTMKSYCIVCKKTQKMKVQKFQDLSVKMKDLVYYQVLESELL